MTTLNQQSPKVLKSSNSFFLTRSETKNGIAKLSWDIGPEGKGALHVGRAIWDFADAPPKVLDYEEIIIIMRGHFGFYLSGGERFEGSAGDILHIPKNTEVRYFGENAELIFVVTRPDSWEGDA